MMSNGPLRWPLAAAAWDPPEWMDRLCSPSDVERAVFPKDLLWQFDGAQWFRLLYAVGH